MTYKENYSKEQLKSKGIYRIHIVHANKDYVGSTTGPRGFIGRWKQHIRELKNNKHHNRHLQNTFNKYREDDFVFEILEYCSNISLTDIWKKEDAWIEQLDTYNNGYNLSPHADDSERFRLAALKSKVPLNQYDLDGNFIKEWDSGADALRFYNCNIKHKGTRRGSVWKGCGYLWAYKEDNFPNKVSAYENEACFKVAVYLKNTGEFLKTYPSLLSCAQDLGLYVANIVHHLKGIDRYVKDYVMIQYDNVYPEKIEPVCRRHSYQLPLKITQIESGKTEFYYSFRDADNKGFTRGTMSKAIKQNRPFKRKGILYKAEFISYEEYLKQLNNA